MTEPLPAKGGVSMESLLGGKPRIPTVDPDDPIGTVIRILSEIIVA